MARLCGQAIWKIYVFYISFTRAQPNLSARLYRHWHLTENCRFLPEKAREKIICLPMTRQPMTVMFSAGICNVQISKWTLEKIKVYFGCKFYGSPVWIRFWLGCNFGPKPFPIGVVRRHKFGHLVNSWLSHLLAWSSIPCLLPKQLG